MVGTVSDDEEQYGEGVSDAISSVGRSLVPRTPGEKFHFHEFMLLGKTYYDAHHCTNWAHELFD